MLNLELLAAATRQEAAIRRVRCLQPAGGAGDKIFPPTYPGERQTDPPRHVFEMRRIGGEDRRCVLLDSVQSQANRLEEALLEAVRGGRIALPRIEVDFAGRTAVGVAVGDLGVISSLDAPHRVFDAILRDSELGGTGFMRSAVGLRLQEAKPRNATALFETSPSALLFGAWNSTGEGGGLGAKFTRCIVSEIVGIGVQDGWRTGIRIDPLGIRRDVEVYRTADGDWTLSAEAAGAKPKRVRPSEINHGNIVSSVAPVGVTVDHAVHTAVVTLAGLRRLSFPDADGVVTEARDNAARTVLAALGLVALCEQDRQGYALRSRCDLVPDGAVPFELVRADGVVVAFKLDTEGAGRLLAEAIAAAEAARLAWSPEPIRLTPQARLVELVARSRRKALAGEAEAGEG